MQEDMRIEAEARARVEHERRIQEQVLLRQYGSKREAPIEFDRGSLYGGCAKGANEGSHCVGVSFVESVFMEVRLLTFTLEQFERECTQSIEFQHFDP